MPLEKINRDCRLAGNEQRLLEKAVRHFALSPRAVHRVLKVARSIADLDDHQHIAGPHLQEAISYRCLDKSGTTS
jgi:magnesium chelatase family protein